MQTNDLKMNLKFFIQKIKNDNAGFTLVELIITVGMMSVLSGQYSQVFLIGLGLKSKFLHKRVKRIFSSYQARC